MKKKIAIIGMGLILGASTISTVFANEEKAVETTDQQEIIEEFNFTGFKHFYSDEKLAEIAAVKGITVEELKEQLPEKGMHFRKGFRGKGHLHLSEEELAKMAAEKGITVEELKDELIKEREAKHEERLEKIAKEKGITVEELKKQLEEKHVEMEAKREEKLAEIAKQQGITVEELKERMEAKREEKLIEIAEQQGITVEELKEKMQDKRGKFIKFVLPE